MKRAVVLLSGGLDSTVTLYWAMKGGFLCTCLIFDYRQRHRKEVFRAKVIAEMAGCEYRIVRFRLPWSGGALVDKGVSIPLDREPERMAIEIPLTYVPSRNTIFISFALSLAESIKAQSIFIGANARDYSGYPDCRPGYFRALERVVRVGTKVGVEGGVIRICAPLVNKTKAQIVRLGQRLGVPFERTWSCYIGGRHPCGRCDACILRAQGFQEAGIQDPLSNPSLFYMAT